MSLQRNNESSTARLPRKPAEYRTKRPHQVNEYHIIEMTNIRSAINRPLKDLDIRFDVVRDIEFT